MAPPTSHNFRAQNAKLRSCNILGKMQSQVSYKQTVKKPKDTVDKHKNNTLRLSLYTSQVAQQPGTYCRVTFTPSIKFSGTHLYTWVERGTVRVKCLVPECNSLSPARARTRTARSGAKRTNRGATAPLQHILCSFSANMRSILTVTVVDTAQSGCLSAVFA